MKKKTSYTFYWLGGKREVLLGKSPADCLNSAGYGNGALRALDFYAPGDEDKYEWNSKRRSWDLKKEHEPTAQ